MSAASFACVTVSASTATIASPTKRTRSVASGGRAKSSCTVAMLWNGARPRSAAVQHGRRRRAPPSPPSVSMSGDQRVRHLRADEHHLQLVAEVEIVDVFGGAEQQFGVFRAQHTCSKNRTNHGRTLPADSNFDRSRTCRRQRKLPTDGNHGETRSSSVRPASAPSMSSPSPAEAPG